MMRMWDEGFWFATLAITVAVAWIIRERTQFQGTTRTASLASSVRGCAVPRHSGRSISCCPKRADAPADADIHAELDGI